MTVTADPIRKSQAIIWEEGGIEIEADVINGEFSYPGAIELLHIFKYYRGFNQFLSAIEKAIKDTKP